jgi:hypothetical protein
MTGSVDDERGFERSAGYAAIASGIAGIGYAIAFVVLKNAMLSGLFLLLAPLLSTVVLVALYGRLRAVDPGLALWVFVIGLAGAIGASVHGAYDLAIGFHPPAGTSDLPNAVDPRGLMTFGASGLALLGASPLLRRAGEFPTWTPIAAFVLGAALVATYLARLIVLDATSPIVLGLALAAGVLSPLVYLGLGAWFLRARSM